MTIDERIEFLVQSTESLHSSLQELHGIVADGFQEIAKTMQLQVQSMAAMTQNIQILADVAKTHEKRISDLEQDEP